MVDIEAAGMGSLRVGLAIASAVALGCAAEADESTTFVPEPACAFSPGGCSAGPETGADSGGTGDSDPGTSSTGGASDDTGPSADSTGGLKLDVSNPDTGDEVCDETDLCCLEPGEVPPHAVLDAFLGAYPAALMPKTVAAVQAFMPTADGHVMAFNLDNAGDEFIDPGVGGVIAANIEAGRDYSKTLVDAVIPVTAMVLDVREDAVEIENLPSGSGSCLGVGWGWGSVIFEADDLSIREVVYLYIGYCAGDGDVEAFFYSEEAAEICAPPM